jgi:hypothetical protein
MDESLSKYREHLVDANQKTLDSFDKMIVALSGGGLGISFTFLKDIVKPGAAAELPCLILAWACLLASLAIVLGSHYTSHLALTKAIGQVDRNETGKGRIGGAFNTMTNLLNALAAITCVGGLLLFSVFVYKNM